MIDPRPTDSTPDSDVTSPDVASIEAVLAALRAPETLPEGAMRMALADWDRFAEPLLASLVKAAAEGVGQEAYFEDAVPFYAAFLLAQQRDTRAFAPLVALMRKDPEDADAFFGDSLGEFGSQLLISTYPGDPATLMELVRDEEADELARAAALGALTGLIREKRIDRDTGLALLRDLLPAVDSDLLIFLSQQWAETVAILDFQELVPDTARLYATGTIDAAMATLDDWTEVRDRARRGALQPAEVELLLPLQDAISALSRFDGEDTTFDIPGRPNLGGFGSGFDLNIDEQPIATVINPNRHVGRNDPCPCGSGKKFKKCCLG